MEFVNIFYFMLFFSVISTITGKHKKCKAQKTDTGFLCTCNAKYCDTTPQLERLNEGFTYQIFTSKNSPGFNEKTIAFSKFPEGNTIHYVKAEQFEVDINKKFQKIKGFGGSFTDSFGINLLSLSQNCQKNLLMSYFGPKGIRYKMCRVPLGGTDFSTRDYSYNDVDGDINMIHFKLTYEDYKYKIPIIKKAKKLSKGKLNLITCNWSPPNWMKTEPNSSVSYLKKEYYQAYANYQIRFLEEYKKKGLNFWGLTAVNEPLTGIVLHFDLNNLVMFPEHQRKWIGQNLGPSLKSKGFDQIKVLTLEDERRYITWWMDTLMADEEAAKYTSGIALHWYYDQFASPVMMDQTNAKYPDKFIIYTESSINKAISGQVIDLGSWIRGAFYAHSIIETLNHWSIGWIDWNMALDMSGGPNHIGGNCEAAILVDSSKDEFYKQPLFYAVGHFSAFTDEKSQRIQLGKSESNFLSLKSKHPGFPVPTNLANVTLAEDIYGTAVINGDSSVTVILQNSYPTAKTVVIKDKRRGTLQATLEADSINSFVYW